MAERDHDPRPTDPDSPGEQASPFGRFGRPITLFMAAVVLFAVIWAIASAVVQ